jgi:hypothetical protein
MKKAPYVAVIRAISRGTTRIRADGTKFERGLAPWKKSKGPEGGSYLHDLCPVFSISSKSLYKTQRFFRWVCQ